MPSLELAKLWRNAICLKKHGFADVSQFAFNIEELRWPRWQMQKIKSSEVFFPLYSESTVEDILKWQNLFPQ